MVSEMVSLVCSLLLIVNFLLHFSPVGLVRRGFPFLLRYYVTDTVWIFPSCCQSLCGVYVCGSNMTYYYLVIVDVACVRIARARTNIHNIHNIHCIHVAPSNIAQPKGLRGCGGEGEARSPATG